MQTVAQLKTMPVTGGIIAANLLIFLIMGIRGMDIWWGNGDQLLHWGANYWPLTITEHQYWRLFSSMFLHAGMWHLVTNMLGLFIAGIFLEPVLRSIRFSVVYVLTGLIADYVSIWYHRSAVDVGASGAIFGIYGVFLALLTTNLFHPVKRKNYLVFIGLFAAMNFIVAGFSGGIDNASHFAGFISGIICGYVLYFTLTKADGKRLPG
ncbi:rhomboid family intramembrane serine protease [Chitinophaga vietnamensis]|uniref:rhomboid family intramembrane serine protease n=1 Tax=Chitinophaga vietnamensis TaxID=2593957 RepID=UPI0011783869|nr:rhomboid family intramembrane serine protease [Chitinophaga vietnamensis]